MTTTPLIHLAECDPEEHADRQETTHRAAAEPARPDPRRAASWCREGVTHVHSACGALWNPSDPVDVEKAARWPGEHPTPSAASVRSALDTTFGADRPTIVVLCGSTRFDDQFQEANYRLTMAGRIVLSVGFYPHASAEHGHGEGVGHNSAEKITLDELHKRKIDLADEVHVLNVDGYIGESTRSEIAYAEAAGKPITYLEDVAR